MNNNLWRSRKVKKIKIHHDLPLRWPFHITSVRARKVNDYDLYKIISVPSLVKNVCHFGACISSSVFSTRQEHPVGLPLQCFVSERKFHVSIEPYNQRMQKDNKNYARKKIKNSKAWGNWSWLGGKKWNWHMKLKWITFLFDFAGGLGFILW